MTSDDPMFGPDDDGLHQPSEDFYENETFWYSFFVPEQAIGAWLYTSVRQQAGVSGGGLWLWDGGAVEPWAIPFYQQFSFLKLPTERGPERLSFPNGTTIVPREPLMSYDLTFDDRDRLRVDLRFDAVEPPVPLLSGAPPYPKSHHFDQTGRVTGAFVLDGVRTDVDCYAMRDRSWGPRAERGYRRVGYTWGADADTSFLTYTAPTVDADDVHTGYLRRDGRVAPIVEGRRRQWRHPEHHWITSMELEANDELGRRLEASATTTSRMILPGATSICINTLLTWTAEGRELIGEDQDVWPTQEWRRAVRP